jgi:hypothetical protein
MGALRLAGAKEGRRMIRVPSGGIHLLTAFPSDTSEGRCRPSRQNLRSPSALGCAARLTSDMGSDGKEKGKGPRSPDRLSGRFGGRAEGAAHVRGRKNSDRCSRLSRAGRSIRRPSVFSGLGSQLSPPPPRPPLRAEACADRPASSSSLLFCRLERCATPAVRPAEEPHVPSSTHFQL